MYKFSLFIYHFNNFYIVFIQIVSLFHKFIFMFLGKFRVKFLLLIPVRGLKLHKVITPKVQAKANRLIQSNGVQSAETKGVNMGVQERRL